MEHRLSSDSGRASFLAWPSLSGSARPVSLPGTGTHHGLSHSSEMQGCAQPLPPALSRNKSFSDIRKVENSSSSPFTTHSFLPECLASRNY